MLNLHVIAIALLFAATLAKAADTTVYRSEDANGTVRFSDVPPAEAGNTEVLRIRPPEAGDPVVAEQQLRAMRYSTDRLAESRRERELEREVARLREQVDAQRSRQQAAPDAIQYVPVYLPAVGIPWRPGHRPRPPHRPDLLPPVQHTPQPLPGIVPGRNSQLMRPLVSDR
ncbi:MAG TPA: DUF4124 domain-containing protein [Halieaceae bacterium]|jgi:hypothetical protein|uniref:DUF4124 domain-containing protein n=1 Tax=Haliea TaxID=475794 RepID=UPI000C555348|nr:DUF4124 domain-containing protein [Haliea sp.]HBQ41520.1 DUF4124 domain-containing protein [Halieaceae bacterium]MAD63690.1 hypothetical protein [Haliea sp.]MAY92051.1 hypothetical protein [Haliea sp.]MBK41975.1 hypothetical protein [Haliea sp.]MBP70017.1 hypothetical protein [Haliea sp.]|tara:strand:- start:313 stop:825 length:513 start_codon:yes stop_codon:yes gene_type:complete